MNKKMFFIISGVAIILVACGPKKDFNKEPGQVSASNFHEPSLEESDGVLGYQDVVLTAEDNQLVIPGQGMGRIPPIKKRSKKSNKNNPSFWPKGPNIENLMEDLKWGMTVKKVFSIFEKKIKAKYEDQMNASSGDLLAEDRIRTQRTKELNKVKKSFVSFNGQTTGYESHMISTEFTHNNNESLLIWDAGKYVEYLFFINNRFWKRMRLFRVDKLGGISLDDFKASMENVIGAPGLEILKEDGTLDKIVWRDTDTYVALIDGTQFFGVFGLRLSSALTETNIAKLRTHAGKQDSTVLSHDISNTINKSISSVDMNDPEESVIDQYTGQTHTDGRFGSTNKKIKDKNKSGASTQPQQQPQQNTKEISDGELDDLF